MPIDDERRSQPRFQPPHPVRVDFPDQQAHIRDFNDWGAYVNDTRPLPAGHVYTIRLWLDDKEWIDAKAMVRRSDPKRGMAVEFVSMSENDRERLHDFIGISKETEQQETT